MKKNIKITKNFINLLNISLQTLRMKNQTDANIHLNEYVRNMMNIILDSELATQYTWTGQSGLSKGTHSIFCKYQLIFFYWFINKLIHLFFHLLTEIKKGIFSELHLIIKMFEDVTNYGKGINNRIEGALIKKSIMEFFKRLKCRLDRKKAKEAIAN